MGVIIAGVVAGLVGLAMIIMTIFRFRRKITKKQEMERDLQPKPVILDMSGTVDEHSPPQQPLLSEYAVQSTVTIPQPPNRLSRAKPPHIVFEPPPLNPVVIPPSRPTTTPLETTYEPMRLTTNTLGGDASGAPLTDEQVDFVNGLWRARVSAADIARVIERMRIDAAAGVQETGEVSGKTNPGTAPPGYGDVMDS
jgi:hypothetical protein